MIDFERRFPDPEPATKVAALGAANGGPQTTIAKIGKWTILGGMTVLGAVGGGPIGAGVGLALGGGLLYGIDSIAG